MKWLWRSLTISILLNSVILFSVFILLDLSATFDNADYFLLLEAFFTSKMLYTIDQNFDAVAFFKSLLGGATVLSDSLIFELLKA